MSEAYGCEQTETSALSFFLFPRIWLHFAERLCVRRFSSTFSILSRRWLDQEEEANYDF
jgi:hypothetical protein